MGKSGNARHGNVTIAAAQTRAQAVGLRRDGVTYEGIARALGYPNKGNAFRAVRQGLREAFHGAGSEQLRQLEAERLDRLQLAVWEKAIKGDNKAIDRVLRIMQQRAELLGLNAPVRHGRRVEGRGRETADAPPMWVTMRAPDPARLAGRVMETSPVAG